MIYCFSHTVELDDEETEGAMVTGCKLVRLFPSWHDDCCDLLDANRDRKIMRRHVNKLRYWPGKRNATESVPIGDLDWSWVQACKGLKIGELRIHDKVAGFDNWRVMFYEGDPPDDSTEMARLWVLMLIKKKRNDFSTREISVMKTRRLVTLERYYKAKK